jgi:hypothetical protein
METTFITLVQSIGFVYLYPKFIFCPVKLLECNVTCLTCITNLL